MASHPDFDWMKSVPVAIRRRFVRWDDAGSCDGLLDPAFPFGVGGFRLGRFALEVRLFGAGEGVLRFDGGGG